MTRRALLSALAAAPLLRYLEPLARWIAPTPTVEPVVLLRTLERDWIPIAYIPAGTHMINVTVTEVRLHPVQPYHDWRVNGGGRTIRDSFHGEPRR